MGETATADEADTARNRSSVPRTIAVDGSAASGKSTIGRKLAAALGYPFLDTGVMYRAVTQAALARGVDVHDAEALSRLAGSLDIEVALPEPGSDGRSRILLDGEDVTELLRGAGRGGERVSGVPRTRGPRGAGP